MSPGGNRDESGRKPRAVLGESGMKPRGVQEKKNATSPRGAQDEQKGVGGKVKMSLGAPSIMARTETREFKWILRGIQAEFQQRLHTRPNFTQQLQRIIGAVLQAGRGTALWRLDRWPRRRWG